MASCQFHGYDGLSCPLCRAELIATEAEAIREGRAAYGVFDWRGDGRYTKKDLVKGPYRLKSMAEKKAGVLNASANVGRGYVVRFYYKT